MVWIQINTQHTDTTIPMILHVLNDMDTYKHVYIHNMQRTDTEPNNVRINGMDTNNTYAQHIHRT